MKSQVDVVGYPWCSPIREGYTDLFIRKRLDLTVEALVLEKKWTPIFAEETRQQARKRLTEYHFDFAKYGL